MDRTGYLWRKSSVFFHPRHPLLLSFWVHVKFFYRIVSYRNVMFIWA